MSITDSYDMSPLGFLTSKSVELPELYGELSSFTKENLPKSSQEFYTNINLFLEDFNISFDNFTLENYKELYTISTMLSQKFLYSLREKNSQEYLHPKLEQFLIRSSNEICICPILTHTSLDVYNWTYKGDLTEDIKTKNPNYIYENIDSKYKFFEGTKGEYEKGFTIPMVIIEAYGADILNELSQLLDLEEISFEVIDNFFDLFLKRLDYIKQSLTLVSKYSQPYFFYNKLRPYLKGYSELYFKSLNEKLTYRGGSAAQSAIIQVFDIILGNSYYISKENSNFNNNKNHNDFILEMREYMPLKHKQFLLMLENSNLLKNESEKLKEIVNENEKLKNKFGDIVKSIESFRRLHFKIVHNFILKQIKSDNGQKAVGTGGTTLEEFLNYIILKTKNVLLSVSK